MTLTDFVVVVVADGQSHPYVKEVAGFLFAYVPALFHQLPPMFHFCLLPHKIYDFGDLLYYELTICSMLSLFEHKTERGGRISRALVSHAGNTVVSNPWLS